MKRYKNYIFDLYGTLVDIWTDEEDPALWQWLAGVYASYGVQYADYGASGAGSDVSSAEEIKARYHQLVSEFEADLAARTGVQYPEIRLEDVFLDLLDGPTYSGSRAAEPQCCAETSAVGARNPEPLEIPTIADLDTWIGQLATTFRLLSRRRLSVYESTIPVLTELKKRGAGVHLLSNAQAVFTWPELRLTGVAPLLDSVYISSDCGMKKPQPQFMQKLLAEQGLAGQGGHSASLADCVMVGNDFSTDIAIAAACGVDAVFINTFGYSAERIARENIYGAAVIEDLSQLLD
ncbi:MAG: HAD family hydrolase [Firmicutes bacterium]|nr:HAD family hydrolase [Bacillota bacterium]